MNFCELFKTSILLNGFCLLDFADAHMNDVNSLCNSLSQNSSAENNSNTNGSMQNARWECYCDILDAKNMTDFSPTDEQVLALTTNEIAEPELLHPNFTQFYFTARSLADSSGNSYNVAILSMFKDLGFISKYQISRKKLAHFILTVQNGYRNVPYHNWSHAFSVAHFAYTLLRLPSVQSLLTSLERFALFLASICHDIDHRGTNNDFQIALQTPLAKFYGSNGSVLERHHFSKTLSILNSSECNILEHLSDVDHRHILDLIRVIIYGTDISSHLERVEEIEKMLKDGYNSTDAKHRSLLMSLLMTASDLSDQTKDFQYSKTITAQIYEEFFSQGDLEKQLGHKPSEAMDRSRTFVPEIQLHFMDNIAIRVFNLLSTLLPPLTVTKDAILRNRHYWAIFNNILKEDESQRFDDLSYLSNPKFDERISEIATKEATGGNAASLLDRRDF